MDNLHLRKGAILDSWKLSSNQVKHTQVSQLHTSKRQTLSMAVSYAHAFIVAGLEMVVTYYNIIMGPSPISQCLLPIAVEPGIS